MFDPVPATSGVVSHVAATLRRGGSVLVVGRAGAGVTSTIEAVLSDLPREVEVVRAVGRSFERDIRGAVLSELAAQLPGSLDLDTDPAGAGPSLRARIVTLDAPTVLAVTSAEHADAVSLAALGYTIARVGDAEVAAVVGSSEVAPQLTEAGVELVQLEPWSTEALASWLADTHGASHEVAGQVHALAEGLPGVAAAIVDDLSPREVAGSEPVPLVPVVTHQVIAAFHDSLEPLPIETRRLLAIVAADPTGDLVTMRRVAAELDLDVDLLAPAEEAGFVEISGRSIRFDHPLRRIAAYHRLAAPSRRTVHRLFAVALEAPEQATRRVAHAAAGVVGGDDQVADDVARVARAVAGRGDHRAARRWWVLAAAITEDPDKRAERLRRGVADEGSSLDKLTKAERRVAEVVARGSSNKETAAELFVSVKTVDAHLQSIYRKLEIR